MRFKKGDWVVRRQIPYDTMWNQCVAKEGKNPFDAFLVTDVFGSSGIALAGVGGWASRKFERFPLEQISIAEYG